jgi:hypothetical protein
MGARRRLIHLTFVAMVGAGCSSSSKSSSPAPEKPADRLAPFEIVEGKEAAFGVQLPRDARVKARFEKTVHTQTPFTREALTAYLRARVKDGNVIEGATMTSLVDVAPAADPQKRLTIDVRSLRLADGTQSEAVIRDATKAPAEPGLSNEQRWQKAGLTTTGKVADPRHLE